ncbi:Hypothetical predicted protein [Cloeon dipterum]|uniref:Uncharacterized protein n=1 Tax=Cloeon dipterum TaxID=197152 RepID=A0A8S1CRE0_9INSE|nr:Hypothetical predicted protein [Cloeon dipterum]
MSERDAESCTTVAYFNGLLISGAKISFLIVFLPPAFSSCLLQRRRDVEQAYRETDLIPHDNKALETIKAKLRNITFQS